MRAGRRNTRPAVPLPSAALIVAGFGFVLGMLLAAAFGLDLFVPR